MARRLQMPRAAWSPGTNGANSGSRCSCREALVSPTGGTDETARPPTPLRTLSKPGETGADATGLFKSGSGIVLTDPRDDELPNVGLVRFEDLETGEDVLVDTSSPKVRQHHKEKVLARRTEQARTFKKLGLDYAVVSTQSSYVPPLRDLFARRARKVLG